MDRHHAQQILLTYRLGEHAPPGSELAEALALAEKDPELAEWLEAQLRYDRRLRSALRSVTPPAGLQQAILRGRPPTPSLWRRSAPRLLAMAAAGAVLLGIWAVSNRGARGPVNVPSPVATTRALPFRDQMVELIAQGRYSLQAQSGSLTELRSFLRRNGGAHDVSVSPALAALSTYGCQVLAFDGRRTTLICFTSPRLGFVHLFVVDSPTEGVGSQPTLAQFGNWNTATWSSGSKTFVVCAQASDSDLRALL